MTLLENMPFARTDIVPSWWTNALQKHVSVGAFQFVVEKDPAFDAGYRVPANPGGGQAAVVIGGKWRWVENTLGTFAIPFGTAAQIIPVYAYASDNNIVSTPVPFTDSTDYSFNVIAIIGGGTPPAPFRRVADIDWDGQRVNHITQLVPKTPNHGSRHAVGGKDPILGFNDIGFEIVGEASFWLPATSLIDGVYAIMGDGSLAIINDSFTPLPNKALKHWWLDPADWVIDSRSGQAALPWGLRLRYSALAGAWPGDAGGTGGGVQVFPQILRVTVGVLGGQAFLFGGSQVIGDSFSSITGAQGGEAFFQSRFTPGDWPADVYIPAIQISSSTGAGMGPGADVRGKISLWRHIDADEAPAILP